MIGMEAVLSNNYNQGLLSEREEEQQMQYPKFDDKYRK